MGRRQYGSDPRGRLVHTFGAFVISANAEAFIMENVPALEHAEGGALFTAFVRHLESAGYMIAYGVLNAADYGAATTRKRFIVVGSRLGRPTLPKPTHSALAHSSLTAWVDVRTAIGDLPPPAHTYPGEPQDHVLVHHTELVRQRFSALRQGSYDNIRKRSRLSWDRPSPSLVAGCLRATRSHIHPGEPRELTNRESARIQGFPDSFLFTGNRDYVAKQIANAVPIALGRAIAAALAVDFNTEGVGVQTSSSGTAA